MPKRRSLIGLIVPLLAIFMAGGLCLPGPRAAGAQVSPRVIIDSSPPGATVYVDGKERGVQGYTATNFKVRLSKGPHRVRLELEGYKPVEQVINVTQAQKFTFALERAPARLEVKTPGTNETAKGGEVFVDGAPAGTVPVPVEVPSGRHLIEVRKQGFKVYSETVELRAGDSRTLWVTLQSEVKAGSLLVAADASGAEVYVDGLPRGVAPVLVDNLPEGDHQVEVRRTEPNSLPWRQNVRVVAGQQAKVVAQTQPATAATGSLMVVSAINDADVVIDSTPRGKVNQEIANLRPGQHIVEVRAKGYGSKTEVVEVEAGKQKVAKIELPQSAEGRGVGVLRVIMVNPVDGAQYFINGRKYDEAAMLNEKGIELAAGQAIVVVRKEGFGEVRKEANVRPGGVETVSIDLRNVGKIFIASEPRGARVLVDNREVGQTPYTAEDVPAGAHMVELRLPDFQSYIEQVIVRGGEQANVNAKLNTAAVADPQLSASQLSSFSAVTVDPGHFTADVGAGYPYFVNVRVTVGAVRKGPFGIDAGVELRTNYYETDVAAVARAQFLKAGPLALGLNVLIGGGGGPRKRNSFIFEAGIPFTLLAGRKVWLTARPYLQVYSDRLCPGIGDLEELVRNNDLSSLDSLTTPEHVGDRCTGGGVITEVGGVRTYSTPRMTVNGGNPVADAVGYDVISKTIRAGSIFDATNPDYREGQTFVLDRFVGARFLIQAVVEFALSPNINLWALIEGAPFQGDRQAFTDKFSQAFQERDLPLYGRLGGTFKF